MSNEKVKDEKVTAEHVARALIPTTPLAVETMYTREEIEASPSSFGVRAEVLAGALRLAEGDELSRSQVFSAIETFKKRKV